MLSIEKLNERLKEIEEILEKEPNENLEYEQEKIEKAIMILENNNITEIDKIVVKSIKWDAPKSVGLPKRIEIEIDLDNVELLEDFYNYADNISNYISNEYEFCHNGFKVAIKESKK